MKRILDIGHTDLRLFLKRKSVYVWLFVVPLLFVYLFGAANKPAGDPYNREPRVLIENADQGFLGRVLVDDLATRGLRPVGPDRRKDAAMVIRIPADFTSRMRQQERPDVQLARNGDSDFAVEGIVELCVLRTLIALNGELRNPAGEGFGPRKLGEGQLRAALAAAKPVTLDARFAGRRPSPAGYNFSLPSSLLMYVMMNLLIFGGAMMAEERRIGMIKRFMVFPITRGELLLGKIYGLMLLGSVQIAFFLVLGRFLFGVNLGANLPAVAFTLLLFAWVAASLGVLAGSVISVEDRVIAVCVLVSLLMAALGGCWWPIDLAPPLARTLALCVPTGWALQALNQLITFGNGITSIVTPLAVLIAFGTVANLLAMRFFRQN